MVLVLFGERHLRQAALYHFEIIGLFHRRGGPSPPDRVRGRLQPLPVIPEIAVP